MSSLFYFDLSNDKKMTYHASPRKRGHDDVRIQVAVTPRPQMTRTRFTATRRKRTACGCARYGRFTHLIIAVLISCDGRTCGENEPVTIQYLCVYWCSTLSY